MANRHDVIIWDADVYGAPDGFTEYTYKKAYALIKQPAEPSQKLLAFARDVEKYSTSNDVPAVVARYFVGYEDNIKAEGKAAYCFNLPDYNWQSIVKILLKEAIKHGLALFDEQIILVLLPNGTILPENTRKAWLQILNATKQENTFPETLIDFYKLLKTRASALLAEHDFVLETDNFVEEEDEFYINYVRQISSGNHKISFGGKGGDSDFKLHSFFVINENNLKKIIDQSDYHHLKSYNRISLNVANIVNPKNSWFTVNNWQSYEDFKNTIKKTSLIWSDTALDIKGLDLLLNGEIDGRIRKHIERPYALIVARLADNPNFEQLASDFISPTENISSKLVHYLYNNVEPLIGIFKEKEFTNGLADTLIEFYQVFSAQIGELLKSNGFKATYELPVNCLVNTDEFHLEFTRKTPIGHHKILFDCYIKNNEFILINNFFQLSTEYISAIMEKSGFVAWNIGDVLLNILQISNTNSDSFIVTNKRSFETFIQIIKESVLKWSNTAIDIQGINELLNGDVDIRVKQGVHQFAYMPYALIAARLANNPQFEELAINLAPTEHDAKIWPAKEKIDPFMAWPKLVKYLRAEESAIAPLINTKPMTSTKTKELPSAIKEELNTYLQENEALNWPRQYTFTFWLIQDDDELLCFLTELINCMVFGILDKAEEAWQEANNPDGFEEDENAVYLREKAELAKYPPIYAAIYRMIESIYSRHSPYEMYLNFLEWGKESVAQLTEGLKLLGLTQLADAYTTVNNSIPPYDPDEDLDKKICAQRFLSAFESVMKYDNTQQLADICEAIRKNYQLFLV